VTTVRERVGFGLLTATAMGVVVLCLGLVGVVVFRGAGSISWTFVSQSPREGMTAGGIFPAIAGTIYVTMITALASIPVGVAAAVYLQEYAPDNWLTRAVRLSIRNLSGVPSIVYGLFGVALFVQAFHLGLSVFASGLTLGLLTLPWIITASEEALKTVPSDHRDGALALGATKWESIWTVVLPEALPGIITGGILGLARAAGETAPILFTGVTFYTPGFPSSVLDEFMALPYHLYVLSTQHHDIEKAQPLAYATALVLLLLVAALTSSAAWLRSRIRAQR
jgi:phosphate transport system permease protein